ncbi:hypothetical protein ACFOKJ_07935 [Vogesella amnigena]|uniref:Uncharacterized protein n=1 Tax=Vogesella amnigena TaxID=1507449 RepID=A0ABV7TTH1_9NEIS
MNSTLGDLMVVRELGVDFFYWLTVMRIFLFSLVVFVMIFNYKFFKKKFPGEKYQGKLLYQYLFNKNNWDHAGVRVGAILNLSFFAYFAVYFILFVGGVLFFDRG